MTKSKKIVLAGVLVGIVLIAGATWFVWKKIFPAEPAPDDIAGWTSYESLEVKPTRFKEGAATSLMIRGIDFGGQFDPPAREEERGKSDKDLTRLATTYYQRQGPLGILFERFNWSQDPWHWRDNTYHADARLPASLVAVTLSDAQAGTLPLSPLLQCWSEPPVAIVGIMGGGTVGSYLRPYQFLDIYEPSPAVIELSLSKKAAPRFTYLQDALDRGANVRVFQGHGRQTLAEKGPAGFYRVMVIEPSRINDRPTIDLLTREALDVFLSKGREDVVIAYHTSNRYYDLADVAAAGAEDAGGAAYIGHFLLSDDAAERSYRYTAEWLVVGRRRLELKPQLLEPIFDEGGGRVTYQELLRRHARRMADRGIAAPADGLWSEPHLRRSVLRDAEPSVLQEYRRKEK